MYNNENNIEESIPMPVLFDIGDTPDRTDVQEMESQGWKLIG